MGRQYRIHAAADRELKRLVAALSEVIRRDAIAHWFNQPNLAFGGLRPLELVERGESNRIWRMVFELESGSHL